MAVGNKYMQKTSMKGYFPFRAKAAYFGCCFFKLKEVNIQPGWILTSFSNNANKRPREILATIRVTNKRRHFSVLLERYCLVKSTTSQIFQGMYHSHVLEKKEAGLEMESVETNVTP